MTMVQTLIAQVLGLLGVTNLRPKQQVLIPVYVISTPKNKGRI